MAKIYELRPVSYTSKIDKEPYFGLIAEEVEKIFPELVDYAKSRYVIPGSTSDELVPNGVKYPMLSVLMLNEIKKHENRMNNYENKLNSMEEKIKQLELENLEIRTKFETENNQLKEEIKQIKQLLIKRKIR